MRATHGSVATSPSRSCSTVHEDEAWARFEREARAASALNHPNICAVYDIGEADGRRFMVLELIEGTTLREHIGGRPMEPAAVIAVAAQIADALEAAHARGVVHRDIKPGNVMIAGRRHVKVLDFGLAKQTASAQVGAVATRESITLAGTIVGTPSHLAPEILRGSPADARSDMWAFGVVLYEMLTGRVPFEGSTAFDIGAAIVHQPRRRWPPTFRPGCAASSNGAWPSPATSAISMPASCVRRSMRCRSPNLSLLTRRPRGRGLAARAPLAEPCCGRVASWPRY